jgi:hypothetical protein
MRQTDWTTRLILLAIAFFLGIIALRPLFEPAPTVHAQTAKFDHVHIVSPLFVYKGAQGLLVMDRRNANVWFIAKRDEVYQDPVFVIRLPFEKLDQAPR